MSRHDRGRLSGSRQEDEDREVRIRELEQRAAKAAGGKMIASESPALTAQERERFWRRVVEYETAPITDNFRQLTDAGIELPDPSALDDETLRSTLWKVVSALARMRVFVSQTDHLNDRELYSWLWHDALRQEVPELPADDCGAWQVDVLGGCSEADIFLYLKYYADDVWRQRWLEDFPDYVMPAHENPPFDRDRCLPKPHDGPVCM